MYMNRNRLVVLSLLIFLPILVFGFLTYFVGIRERSDDQLQKIALAKYLQKCSSSEYCERNIVSYTRTKIDKGYQYHWEFTNSESITVLVSKYGKAY